MTGKILSSLKTRAFLFITISILGFGFVISNGLSNSNLSILPFVIIIFSSLLALGIRFAFYVRLVSNLNTLLIYDIENNLVELVDVIDHQDYYIFSKTNKNIDLNSFCPLSKVKGYIKLKAIVITEDCNDVVAFKKSNTNYFVRKQMHYAKTANILYVKKLRRSYEKH